jgi:hypothetical protein
MSRIGEYEGEGSKTCHFPLEERKTQTREKGTGKQKATGKREREEYSLLKRESET